MSFQILQISAAGWHTREQGGEQSNGFPRAPATKSTVRVQRTAAVPLDQATLSSSRTSSEARESSRNHQKENGLEIEGK